MITVLLNSVYESVAWLAGIFVGGPPKGCCRKLGFQEAEYLECHDLGEFNVGSLVFVSSDCLITKEHLHDVMRRVMLRHPLLRMRVTRYGGELYWQQMDDVTPDVRVQETNDWNAVLEDTMLETYNTESGPLWRLTLLPDVTSDYNDDDYKFHAALVFGFCHCVIDGQGEY